MDDRTAIPPRATVPPATAVPPVAPAPLKRGWLSPINQRRWQNFKANRRGYISLWVFAVLFVLVLFKIGDDANYEFIYFQF